MALARRHSAKGAANLGLYSAVRQGAVTAQEQEWLAQPGLEHVAAQASVQIHRTWASVVVAAGLNRGRTSQGVTEEADPGALQTAAEATARCRRNFVHLTGDEPHVVSPDGDELAVVRILGLGGGPNDPARREDDVDAVGRVDPRHYVAVARQV